MKAFGPQRDGQAPPGARGQRARIYSSAAGVEVPFAQMLDDLRAARIVYLGEVHTDARQHDFQLRVIRGLRERGVRLAVGLEMFDRSYQSVLDRWSAGALDEESFLRRTHWYANWRFDYGLYRPILDYLKEQGIRIVALNLPFHIPPKIRSGGVDHLSAVEKGYLPLVVDTEQAAHREEARRAFDRHDFKGRTRFEDFYLAQCVWEEVMAESADAYLSADELAADLLVVLAGNGHIQHRHGIPERTFRRNGLPYRTVVQLPEAASLDPAAADFIVLFD